jgi:hypothetical protein
MTVCFLISTALRGQTEGAHVRAFCPFAACLQVAALLAAPSLRAARWLFALL